MMGAYTFGHPSTVTIGCAELDTFITDLCAVYEKHGVMLGADRDTSYGMHLERFDPADVQRQVESAIREAWLPEGVAWLNAAFQRWHAKKEAVAVEEAKAGAKRLQNDIDQAVKDGIEWGGRRFKLVEDK